jgi:hypothetical protein
MYGEPWKLSSALSSPVKEAGARKPNAKTSSNSEPSGAEKVPNTAVRGERSSQGVLPAAQKQAFTISQERGPLTRRTASAPWPTAVATATMVSSVWPKACL